MIPSGFFDLRRWLLAFFFAAEGLDQIRHKARQLAGDQGKVGIEAGGHVFAGDVVILLAQLFGKLKPLDAE